MNSNFKQLYESLGNLKENDNKRKILKESFDINEFKKEDLYPLLRRRGVKGKDLKKAADIVYSLYYDENFESGFTDDMVSEDDFLDFVDDDLEERVETLEGNEPFAANFDGDDVEWLKGILELDSSEDGNDLKECNLKENEDCEKCDECSSLQETKKPVVDVEKQEKPKHLSQEEKTRIINKLRKAINELEKNK